MKRLSLLFAVACCLILTTVVSASSQTSPVKTPGVSNQLVVTASRLSFASTTYRAGNNLTGMITLKNYSNYPVSDLYYQVKLLGGVVDLDTGPKVGPLSLKANESRTLTWQATLPPSSDGQTLRFELRTAGGQVLSQAHQPIKISTPSGLRWSQAIFSTPGFDYLPNTKAVFDKKAKFTFTGIITNPAQTPITYVPQYVITNNFLADRPVLTFWGATTTIGVGGTSTLDLTFPVQNQTPGQYKITLKLLDEHGVEVLPSISNDYVLIGDVALIHNVGSVKSGVKAGDPIVLNIGYSGNNDDQSHLYDVKIDVVSDNGKGVTVAGYTGQWNFSSKLQTQSITIPATLAGNKLLARVVISKDGQMLSVYDRALGQPVSGISSFWKNRNLNVVWLIILLLLIAGGLIWKRKKQVALVLILLSLGLGGYQVALAAVPALSCGEIGFDSSVASIQSPGATFPITGQVNFHICHRGYYRIYFTADQGGDDGNFAGWQYVHHCAHGDHCANGGDGWTIGLPVNTAGSNADNYGSSGYFTAPTTPGTYTVNWHAEYCKDKPHKCKYARRHHPQDTIDHKNDGTFTFTVAGAPCLGPSCPTDLPVCPNGATNYPTCTTPGTPAGVCANGALNYPTCSVVPPPVDPRCPNGNTNYPACNVDCTTTGTCVCANGATNYPTCTTGGGGGGGCINGATNPPACTFGPTGCINGATNPPACNEDSGGGGICGPKDICSPTKAICLSGSRSTPTWDNTAKKWSWTCTICSDDSCTSISCISNPRDPNCESYYCEKFKPNEPLPLNPKKTSVINPSSYDQVRTFVVNAYSCDPTVLNDCRDCTGAGAYAYPIDWFRDEEGSLGKLQTRCSGPFAIKKPTLDVPSLVSGQGDATLTFKSSCAPQNEPSPMNGDWLIKVKTENRENGEMGIGSFNVKFLDSHGKSD